MGFPVNEEKQAFIRRRLGLDTRPKGREGKAARQYYAGLYHRTDAGVRRMDAEAWWAEERAEGQVDDGSGGGGSKAVVGKGSAVTGDAGKAESRKISATTKTANQTPGYGHRIDGSTSPKQNDGERESSTTTTVATNEKAEDGREAVSPARSQDGDAERKASSTVPRKTFSTRSRKASSTSSRKPSSTASRKASSTASRRASPTASLESSTGQAAADGQNEAASAETAEDRDGMGDDALAAAMEEEVSKSATTEQQDEASLGGEGQHDPHETGGDAVEDSPPATVSCDPAPETVDPASVTTDSITTDETAQVESPSKEDELSRSPRIEQDAGTSASAVDVGAQIGPVSSLPGLGSFNNDNRWDNDEREAVHPTNARNDDAAEATIARSTTTVRDDDSADEDATQHEDVDAPAAPSVVAPGTVVPEAATVPSQTEDDASLAHEENAANDAGPADEASIQDDTFPVADEPDAYSDVYSPSVSSNDTVPSVSPSPPPTQTAPPPQDTSSYGSRKRSRESEHEYDRDTNDFDRENDAIDRWARAMDGNAVGSGMAATRYGADEIGVDDEDEYEDDEPITQARAEESSFDEMVRQALDGDDGDPTTQLYVAPDAERREEREPVRPHKRPRLRRPIKKANDESGGGSRWGDGEAGTAGKEADGGGGGDAKGGSKEGGAPTYDYGTTLDALLRELS